MTKAVDESALNTTRMVSFFPGGFREPNISALNFPDSILLTFTYTWKRTGHAANGNC